MANPLGPITHCAVARHKRANKWPAAALYNCFFGGSPITLLRLAGDDTKLTDETANYLRPSVSRHRQTHPELAASRKFEVECCVFSSASMRPSPNPIIHFPSSATFHQVPIKLYAMPMDDPWGIHYTLLGRAYPSIGARAYVFGQFCHPFWCVFGGFPAAYAGNWPMRFTISQ